MVKILRKYNKWLLAGGGSLLMLTFLISGNNNPFAPNPEKVSVAEVLSQPVTNKVVSQFSNEFDALKEFVPFVVQGQIGCENGTHWMLLVREAENAGLVGEGRDGAEWLPDLAQSEAIAETRARFGQYGPRVLQQFLGNPQYMQQQVDQAQQRLTQGRPYEASRHAMTLEQFDHALSRLRGVARLINTYDGAARLSDKMLVLEARRYFDSVLADAVIIPADRITGEIPDPTPEQLQAHFEKYQKVKPADGEFGIGYVLPERAKLAWFEVNAGEIAKVMKPDPIAVSKEFQLHRDKYPGEFAAEKGKIEQAIVKSRTDELMGEIDRVYKARLRAATRKLEADGPIRKLPADWATTRPTIEGLAEEVRQAVEEAEGVKLPTFKVVRLADAWTRLDEAASLPGIGKGVLKLGTRTSDIQEVLASVADFDPKAPMGLQTLVPSDAPLEVGEDRYYFCILATKGEAPAESLDEVRPRAILDFKRIAAFEKLKAQAPQFQSLAVSDGLEALGRSFEKPASGATPAVPALPVMKNLTISRNQVAGAFGQSVPNVGELDVPELRDAVMNAADAMGPTTLPTPANIAARTSVVPLAKSLSVVVVQTSTPTPMSAEDLRTFSGQVVTSLLRLEQRADAPKAANPFSFEALKERMKYKSLVKNDKTS